MTCKCNMTESKGCKNGCDSNCHSLTSELYTGIQPTKEHEPVSIYTESETAYIDHVEVGGNPIIYVSNGHHSVKVTTGLYDMIPDECKTTESYNGLKSPDQQDAWDLINRGERIKDRLKRKYKDG